MYNIYSCHLWLSLFILILLCELYVPFRKRFFISVALGAFAACFSSFIFSDMFKECIFFLSASIFFYSISLVINAYITHKKRDLREVIALFDIEENSYGYVFGEGRSYIIKNGGRKIKKGEVFMLERAILEGESLVP